MNVQTRMPVYTVTDSREAVANAVRAAGELYKLDRARGWAELNALFKRGYAPRPPLDGVYDGKLVALHFGAGLTPLFEGVASLYLPWRGKVFEAGRGRGINTFARNSLPLSRLIWPGYKVYRNVNPSTYRAFEFQTSFQRGLFDPELDVLRLDYRFSGNPSLTVGRVIDEVVELAEGLYLGKAHLHAWGGPWRTVAFFTLEPSAVRAAQPTRGHLLDPRKAAFYETQDYINYYLRRWPALAKYSLLWAKELYGLPWPDTLYIGYLVARAQQVFAPMDHDMPRVERYIRDSYLFLRKRLHDTFDVDEVTRWEVEWWVAHREHFADPDNSTVVEAMTRLYAALLQTSRERVRDIAFYRAQAVLYSDWWVKEGKSLASPLLVKEEDAFYKSYTALRELLAERQSRRG